MLVGHVHVGVGCVIWGMYMVYVCVEREGRNIKRRRIDGEEKG
jgi:hypothetical protein